MLLATGGKLPPVDTKKSIALDEGLDSGIHTFVWLPSSNSSHTTVAEWTKGEGLNWLVGPLMRLGGRRHPKESESF